MTLAISNVFNCPKLLISPRNCSPRPSVLQSPPSLLRFSRIVPQNKWMICASASASAAGSSNPNDDLNPYEVLGVNPLEGYDKVKQVYTRKRKEAESMGDQATAALAYDKLMMQQLSNRQMGMAYGSFKIDTLLDTVKWDGKGLAVGIAQNVDTGAILMQGFVNRDALATTISSQKATFYSRSRSALWTKGETSNNFIHVHDIFLDCDRDSIIYLGKPDGPTCHTGSETCYYTSVYDYLEDKQVEGSNLALTTLSSLESTISRRKAELAVDQSEKPSWTKRLLLDQNLLCSKIREEADELCRTLEENEDGTRVASEMGDVLYHAMVLLARRGEIRRCTGTSPKKIFSVRCRGEKKPCTKKLKIVLSLVGYCLMYA